MKKIKLAAVLLSFCTVNAFSQDNVGIGTLTPHPSALLELSANDKGFLVPRINLQSVADVTTIAAPETSLLVYNTNAAISGGNGVGFYYWDGAQWVQAIGPQGPQGPAGNNGAPGNPGANGTDGVGIVSTIDNNNGTFTINYSDGSSFTTIDLTGPQGPTGNAGAPGQQGIQGPPGNDGATGPQGPQGATGATGPQGPAGPAGPTGATGSAGATGATGPQGPAGPVGCTNNNFVIKSNGTTAVCSQIFDNGTNVGINNTSPTYRLHVNGTIKSDGITESSDFRLKKNIQPLTNAMNTVLQLNGVSYNWKTQQELNKEQIAYQVNANTKSEIGFIAQEVEKMLPQLVNTDNEGFKSVEYSKMVALLVEACKELFNTVEKQQAELNTIKSALQANLKNESSSFAISK